MILIFLIFYFFSFLDLKLCTSVELKCCSTNTVSGGDKARCLIWITVCLVLPITFHIRSRLAWKCWWEVGLMILAHWLASGLDPFGQNLKTWHSRPEPNQIQAGFAEDDPGHLNATESETGKLVAGRLRSARTRSSDSCKPACFLTRCFWPKPDQAIQIGSRLSLHNMIRAFFGRPEPNWMRKVGWDIYDLAQFWLHSGHNGHNWP